VLLLMAAVRVVVFRELTEDVHHADYRDVAHRRASEM